MDGSIACKARKPKRKGVIHVCFTKDNFEHVNRMKIFHKSYFNDYILDYEGEEKELFHDVL